ncbi:MAG TPA: segregation/condensation protein A, partial [Clostridiales bacterium]|nr:segregation/condensation protein A [Clostridiales bacterium]
HLIDKNKVNIYDIPINEITEQYIEYIRNVEYSDLDSMSEFLVLASELISIKSKMLLPKDEEDELDEDPRHELVERLLEYKMFKYISDLLKDKEFDASKTIYKESTIPEEVNDYKEEIDPSEVLGDITLSNIQKVFSSLLKKQEEKIDPIRSKFGEIKQEKISVEDKLKEIIKYASNHKKFLFTDLLSEHISKPELIVVFLGILELTKSGQVVIKQSKLFDDFIIRRVNDKLINKEPTEAVLHGN